MAVEKGRAKITSIKPQFQPSEQLKAAREITEISRSSGHPRPMLDYAGLETLFQVLENEERMVFGLQMQLGEKIMDLDATRLQLAEARTLLRELVELEPTEPAAPGQKGFVCVFCEEDGIGQGHTDDCLITAARKVIG